jgi:hypothetical protein
VQEAADHVRLRYLTPIDRGFPHAPRVKAMLLETAGKRRLYAEIRTNYGDRPLEAIGYEVTLSYPATIQGPIEIILVEWRGHGWYYGPFEVYRAQAGVGRATPSAEPAPAPTPGAAPAAPEPAAAPSPAPKVETLIPGRPGAVVP